MYNLVKESTLYYKQIQKGQGYREELVEPFYLLTDIEIFNKAKENNDSAYKNLCDIILKMDMQL